MMSKYEVVPFTDKKQSNTNKIINKISISALIIGSNSTNTNNKGYEDDKQ